MANDVSTLVLKIDSDGVIQAAGNLAEFSKKAKQSSKSASDLENQSLSLDNVFGKFNLTTLSAIAGVKTLISAFSSLTSGIKKSIQVYSEFEQIQNSLSGVMRSAEKGKELFEDLRAFSFDTTFGVDTLANAASQLISTGTATDDLRTRLKQLGDIAGGSTEKFNELVSIFSKIQNTGKASSMQLQQLALRGVPIYQVLKEIGVQGNATAKDIVDAFEQMTSSAGMFYNNMQSINDTIEGRKGFVSDTYRELLASFGEASGAAELYKQILDIVYEALQKVVNVLQVINSNPVYQAIFRGALVSALTLISSIISIQLITALRTVIGALGGIRAIISALSMNPFALAITGAAALTIGAVALYKNLKKTKDETDNATESMNKFKEAIDGVDLSKINSTLESNGVLSGEDRLKTFAKEVVDLQDKIEKAQKTVDNLGKQKGLNFMQSLQLQQAQSDLNQLPTLLDKAIERYNIYEETLKRVNEEKRNEASVLAASNANYSDYLSTIESIESAYANTSQGQLEELKKQRESYANLLQKTWSVKVAGPEYGNATQSLSLGTDTTQQLLYLIDELDKKIANTEKKTASVVKTWQEVFSDITDVDVSDIEYGTDAVNRFFSVLQEKENSNKKLSDILGDDWNISDDISGLESIIKELYEAREELLAVPNNMFGGDNVEDRFNELLNELSTVLQEKRSLASFEDITGINIGSIDDISDGISKYIVTLDEAEEKTKKFKEIFGEDWGFDDDIQFLENKLNTLKSLMQSLLDRGLIKQNSREYNELVTEINDVAQAFENAKEKKQEFLTLEEIKEAKANGNYYQQYFGEKIQNASMEYQNTGKLNIGEYTTGLIGSTALSVASGSDVGNFIEGFQQGGIFGGIINTVIGALAKVASSCEGFDKVLNPITEWLMELKPIIQQIFNILSLVIDIVGDLFDILSAIAEILQPITTMIQGVLKVLLAPIRLLGAAFRGLAQLIHGLFSGFGDWVDSWSSWSDDIGNWWRETDEEKQKELERLKALNKQYESLSNAIEEQEEYYLKQRLLLDVGTVYDALSTKKVNDMILTPSGAFSTSPEDTILAMKHPENLIGGGVQMQVIINNTVSDTVKAEVKQQGTGDYSSLIVTISRMVAQDVATGANGWDGALQSRQARLSGRSI